jgi:uncharacterized protein Usg
LASSVAYNPQVLNRIPQTLKRKNKNMKPQFPTVQEQIDYWNKKEGEELERVSRIQDESLDKRDESRDATNETREALRPSYKARLANGLELTTAMELERQRDCLRIALEEVELRTTQAQIASRIGKKTKERQISFLTGQLEQIGQFARQTITENDQP